MADPAILHFFFEVSKIELSEANCRFAQALDWERRPITNMLLSQGVAGYQALWDESVLEKPESLAAERLCAVRSSKALRLKRIKPGYFNPPGGRPIFVPGFNWLQVLVLGRRGPPTLAQFAWWTTRGAHQTTKRELEKQVLDQIDRRWGKAVVHIWDRGFAGQPWLPLAFLHAARFVMRWPKNYQLLDAQGQTRQPGQISKAIRSWEQRLLWDARQLCSARSG